MIDRTLLNNGFPGSTWGNLGLWTHAQDYPAACETLAVQLAERVQLAPGHSVFDVGFGYGDQLVVWKQRFGVGRITGLETDAAGLAEARRKLAAYTDVTLCLGDKHAVPAHERYDRVLALDCAYHFAPRSAFLAQAYRALHAGGVLGLTDIVLAEGQNPRQHARLAQACGIPLENLLTPQRYAQALKDLGFVDVRLEPLDDAVFAGFSRFALRHLRQHAASALGAGGLKILATALAAAWLRRGARVHYMVISAQRPSTANTAARGL